jgi:hypothetical protein
MTKQLIWVHEDTLSLCHPVFADIDHANAIFIWDESYWKKTDIGLKRLIFIYETLCDLPVQIIKGDMLTVLRDRQESEIRVGVTNNPFIKEVIAKLALDKQVVSVENKAFVTLKSNKDFRRFFQYWKEAEKTIYSDRLVD